MRVTVWVRLRPTGDAEGMWAARGLKGERPLGAIELDTIYRETEAYRL